MKRSQQFIIKLSPYIYFFVLCLSAIFLNTGCSLFTRQSPPEDKDPSHLTTKHLESTENLEKTSKKDQNNESSTTSLSAQIETANSEQKQAQTEVSSTLKHLSNLNGTKASPPANQPALEWDYDGVIGPKMWASLNSEYKICSEGKKQSPIPLTWKKPKKILFPLSWKYTPSSVEIIDDGHGIVLAFPDKTNYVMWKNKKYTLFQAYIHTPSEHQFGNKKYDMEVQLLHIGEKGSLLMLSSFFNAGKNHTGFEQILSHLPSKKYFKTFIKEKNFPVDSLLPTTKTYYSYQGSLTSPPCTEGVQWFVFNSPLEISAQNLKILKERYPGNIRPTQDLNHRKIENF